MAAKNAPKETAEERAAVDAVAGQLHDSWRRAFLKSNPDQKGQARMRMRGGVMVDVNQPWSKLHPNAQVDNKNAARAAYRAVKTHPKDREAAAAFVHVEWIKRNKGDASQPKELFKPYARLPEVEKEKDRSQVDDMKNALARLRKAKKAPAAKKAAKKAGRKTPKVAALASVQVDARSWRQLQSAAKQLSSAIGREVPAEMLLAAGADAMAAVAQALARRSTR